MSFQLPATGYGLSVVGREQEAGSGQLAFVAFVRHNLVPTGMLGRVER